MAILICHVPGITVYVEVGGKYAAEYDPLMVQVGKAPSTVHVDGGVPTCEKFIEALDDTRVVIFVVVDHTSQKLIGIMAFEEGFYFEIRIDNIMEHPVIVRCSNALFGGPIKLAEFQFSRLNTTNARSPRTIRQGEGLVAEGLGSIQVNLYKADILGEGKTRLANTGGNPTWKPCIGIAAKATRGLEITHSAARFTRDPFQYGESLIDSCIVGPRTKVASYIFYYRSQEALEKLMIAPPRIDSDKTKAEMSLLLGNVSENQLNTWDGEHSLRIHPFPAPLDFTPEERDRLACERLRHTLFEKVQLDFVNRAAPVARQTAKPAKRRRESTAKSFLEKTIKRLRRE